jgi:hypothetical protein
MKAPTIKQLQDKIAALEIRLRALETMPRGQVNHYHYHYAQPTYWPPTIGPVYQPFIATSGYAQTSTCELNSRPLVTFTSGASQ